ncbi:MAG: hypothetical protein JWN62_1335 [Acidimicrobiales bacterium]|nr:hypothetical protein [Acidimicrobiales bacterium]
MDTFQSDQSLVLARRCITASRIALGVLALAVIIANAINRFSPDTSSQGPGAPLKVEISRFLSSILLTLGVFTTILLLSVFASIYVEQLALRLKQSQDSDGSGRPLAPVLPPDDVQWQK